MSLRVHVNVFIQAKNLQYGFDFCPAFWDWLDQQSASGRVASIEKVLDELKAGADELTTWRLRGRAGCPRQHRGTRKSPHGKPVGHGRPR